MKTTKKQGLPPQQGMTEVPVCPHCSQPTVHHKSRCALLAQLGSSHCTRGAANMLVLLTPRMARIHTQQPVPDCSSSGKHANDRSALGWCPSGRICIVYADWP
jgi:hypothetical protein